MEVVVSGSGVANGETERFSASRLILEATQAEAAESLGAKAKAEPFQLIDSLAYIDGVDTALLSRAQALIQDELKRVSKRPAEYLKELPKAEDVSFENCPLSARAFERLQRQGRRGRSGEGGQEPAGVEESRGAPVGQSRESRAAAEARGERVEGFEYEARGLVHRHRQGNRGNRT